MYQHTSPTLYEPHTCSRLCCCYTLFIPLTQDHRMLGLDGSSGGHLVQPSCSRRTNYSWWPRAMSRFLISPRLQSERFHILPGNLCQCSVTLTLKKVLRFRGNLLCFTVCPLPLVLQMKALFCYKCFVSTVKVYHSFYLLLNLYDKNSYSNILALRGSIIRLLSTHRANYHFTV